MWVRSLSPTPAVELPKNLGGCNPTFMENHLGDVSKGLLQRIARNRLGFDARRDPCQVLGRVSTTTEHKPGRHQCEPQPPASCLGIVRPWLTWTFSFHGRDARATFRLGPHRRYARATFRVGPHGRDARATFRVGFHGRDARETRARCPGKARESMQSGFRVNSASSSELAVLG